MGKQDRQLQRLRGKPHDFTYEEAASLLSSLGYIKDNKGKTSGSRVKFYNPATKHLIMLHRPHPNRELKAYQVNDLISALEEQGVF